MDQPDLDSREHETALRALRKINAVSRSSATLAGPILELAKRLDRRTLTVCDVASGGGDVAIDLYRHTSKRGVELQITGVDVSPVGVAHAKQNAERAGIDIQFVEQDVLASNLPRTAKGHEPFDVVMSSLFMHHLDPPDVKQLLASMSRAAHHLVLVNDLRRSRVGWYLAQIVCRLVTRSYVVHIDGPRSVEGAYTNQEFIKLCCKAGLETATIERVWPFRFLMTYQKLG